MTFQGTTLSTGSAQGPAKVLLFEQAESDEYVFTESAIIITDRFHPKLSLHDPCAGIVSVTDDVASPAATYARAQSVPAVGDCPRAIERLETGQRVVLDADEGTVTVFEQASGPLD